MTLFLPLDGTVPLPARPSFSTRSSDLEGQLQQVVKTILKAKRIVVLCGAGISVNAGIPDFRSPEGLFQTLKKENPKDFLTSGKDLFDASVFNSEHTTALFLQMIARLSELSIAAEPTPFHKLLRVLDDKGKLLRVYTQNIDALELKSGLSFGVPRPKGKIHGTFESTDGHIPRCIPLHGTLKTLHCQICNHVFPLENYIPVLSLGSPPECPECESMERTRQLVGKRARGIGKLRPSVVLYNEAHKDGEEVGGVMQKDLMGTKGRCGADLLLVVGTSLKIPGTKRMVREFSRSVQAKASSALAPNSSEPKAIYMNLDFPVPMREWEGVFDVWIQGDAQKFAELIHQEIGRQIRVKEQAEQRKRQREMEAECSTLVIPQTPKRKKTTLPPTPPWDNMDDPMSTPLKPKGKKARLLAEVVITPHRHYLPPAIPLSFKTPTKSKVCTSFFGVGRLPPTPEKSPPPAFGLNRASPSKLNYGYSSWDEDFPMPGGSRLTESYLRTRKLLHSSDSESDDPFS